MGDSPTATSIVHFMGSVAFLVAPGVRRLTVPGFEDSPAGFMRAIRFADSLTALLNLVVGQAMLNTTQPLTANN